MLHTKFPPSGMTRLVTAGPAEMTGMIGLCAVFGITGGMMGCDGFVAVEVVGKLLKTRLDGVGQEIDWVGVRFVLLISVV